MGNGGKTGQGIRFVLTAAVLAGVTTAAAAACRDDRVTVQGDWGRVNFTVQVADTPQERAQGLMNVPQMPTLTGMLFAYDAPQHATFWMHNTLIPLDMLFADETGVIRTVHSNARPMDDTTIDGGTDIKYVLEINGGMAERLGIAPGDLMQHPVIGPNAVLACSP